VKNDPICFQHSRDKVGRERYPACRDDNGSKVFMWQLPFRLVLGAANDEASFFGKRCPMLKNVEYMEAHMGIGCFNLCAAGQQLSGWIMSNEEYQDKFSHVG
jgi:hypothetical protein